MSSKNVICNALPHIVHDASHLPPNPPIQEATPRPYEAFDLLLASPNTLLPKNIFRAGGDFNSDFSPDFSIQPPFEEITINFKQPDNSLVTQPATYTASILGVPYVIYQVPAATFVEYGWYLGVWHWGEVASRQYAFYIAPQAP